MEMLITRNQAGELRMFRWQAIYNEELDMWYQEHLEDGCGDFLPEDFPEVTFENSPMEVELVLKK